MTKQNSVRRVPLAEHGKLEALVDEAARGVTIVFTREGRDVALLSAAESPDQSVCEERASYAPTAETPAPATALMRLISGPATRSVLGVFLRDPERQVHQREIARRGGVGLRSAQLALERLEGLGLVRSERDGNRRYYRAVRSERFEELRALLGREIGISHTLVEALKPFASRIHWAFLFGSMARGEDSIGSDIDLLVVGDLSHDELVAPLAEAQRRLGREIEAVVYRPDEFRAKSASGNHFLRTVTTGPRVDLIGGSDAP